MDLLLDINVAVDICAKRPAYYQDADLALAKCRQEGGRLWLYAGSVQTLEYVTRDALKHTFRAAGQPITARQLHYHIRQVLKTFAEDKQWLAALAAKSASTAKANATFTPASASAGAWTPCNAPSSPPNSTASTRRSPSAKPSRAATTRCWPTRKNLAPRRQAAKQTPLLKTLLAPWRLCAKPSSSSPGPNQTAPAS